MTSVHRRESQIDQEKRHDRAAGAGERFHEAALH